MNDRRDQARAPHDTHASAPHRRGAVLTRIVLIIIAVIGVGGAMSLPAIRKARDDARRNTCHGHFGMIGLALLNYESDKGEFPPAYTTDAEGKPLHSRRTLILPYMEEGALFSTIDLTKAWDDPANAKALAAMPEVYQCPSRAEHDNRTTYLAVVMPGSFFQPAAPRKNADVKDGTSNTITFIEVDHAHAVPWMAPSDADEALIQSLTQRALEPPHGGGFTAAYADGHANTLDAETPAEVLRQRISIAGGNPRKSDTSE